MKRNELATATQRHLALSTLHRAWRNTLVGFLGSPAVAGAWALTCARARDFDAGRVNPWSGPLSAGWILQLLYDHLWIALYATFGMTGLHVTFAALVTITVAIGAWGSVESRALNRRLGPEAIRELRLNELLSASPEMKARVQAGAAPPRRRLAREVGGAPVLALVRIVILVVPFGLAALTVALIWVALRT